MPVSPTDVISVNNPEIRTMITDGQRLIDTLLNREFDGGNIVMWKCPTAWPPSCISVLGMSYREKGWVVTRDMIEGRLVLLFEAKEPIQLFLPKEPPLPPQNLDTGAPDEPVRKLELE